MKTLLVTLGLAFLAGCVYAPAKDISGQLAAGRRITYTPTILDISKNGSLHLKGAQMIGGEGLILRISNKYDYTESSATVELSADLNCSNIYHAELRYMDQTRTILTEYWPTPNLTSETFDIKLRWTAAELTVNVYNIEKTVNISFLPAKLTLTAKGAPFIISP